MSAKRSRFVSIWSQIKAIGNNFDVVGRGSEKRLQVVGNLSKTTWRLKG